MQKFLRFLMLAVLFLPFALQAQSSLTVCTATGSNEFVPFQGFNADYAQHNQLIYPANMLTAINGQTIMQMVFYIDQSASNGQNTSASRLGTWTVSLGETTETTLNGLDNTTSLTQVYEGYFDCSTGTLTLEFNVPYTYNGGNLLVDLTHAAASWNRWYFLGVEATGASYTYGSQRDFLPQCTFIYGTPPTCAKPTALTASLTPGDGTVASLSWTESGTATAWQICLNGDENNLIDATTNPFELTGLTPETAYTAKVRAYCDATDQSDWSTTITFTPTNAYTFTINDGTTNNTNVPIYGSWVDNITKSQFIIPATNLTPMLYGAVNKLTFYANEPSVNWGNAQFDVYLTATNETTLSSLADYSTMTQVYAGSLSISDNKMEVTFTTPYTYMGGNLMIGFLQTVSGDYVASSWYGTTANGASMGGYGNYINQQNFLPKTTFFYTPGQQPDCLPVNNLTATNITSSTVTLTWVGDASSYTVYDMSDTSVVMSGISDNTYTITDLDPNTDYLFGVQANCATSDALTIYTSARTTCAPVALPFTEDFSASLNNDPCWNGASGVTAGEVLADSTTLTPGNITGWTYRNSEDNGIAAGHYRVNIYGANCKYWLITPEIDLSTATNPLLNFDAAFTVYSGIGIATGFESNPTQAFMILVTTNGGQTWTTASNISLASIASTSYIPQYIDLSAYVGETVRIAFYAQSTSTGGDNNLHIDNISVAESTGSICYPVYGIAVDSVTNNSVFLSWRDASNTGATYTIYNMADTSVVADNVSDHEYVVTGLTGSTSYTFGIEANCSATDASFLRTVSVTTDCENGSCQISITGTDAYNDGWNGASITIVQNGATVGFFTLTDGTTNTANFSVCDGLPVSFIWNSGEYDDECDFTIYNGFNTAVFTANGDDITGTFYTLADACSNDVPPTTDSLIFNLSINNPALGSITPAPGSYAIALNDSIVLHATPNEGANFQGWRVIIAGQTLATVPANPFTIPVSPNNITLGEMTIVALFSDSTSVPDSMTIVINTADPTMGTTNPAPGTYNFAVGSTSYVTAVPNEGYHLLYWVEYLEIAGMSVSDTLIADTIIVEVLPIMAGMVSSLTAHFEADEPATDSLIINLTINDPTLGTINPNPGTYAVALNDVMMITATPNDGVTFEGYRVYWNGQIITNVPAVVNPFPCTVTPDLLNFGEITIMALFSDGSSVPDSLTLIVNTNDATMGTTDPAPGIYSYAVGDTSVLSAIPNDGYHFLYWIESVSVAGITMNDTIYAPVLTTLINQMMANMTLTVTAYFEANDPGVNYYTVIVRSANTAMGTVSSDIPLGQLAENTVVTVTATPRTGYQFVNWTDGEGNIINATNPYTFTVTEDITLVANFELADGINDIDASNVLIYAHNSTITVLGAEGHDVFVYDMNGRCIYQRADANETENISMSSAGIYMVRIDNAIFKKVVIVK